MRKLKKKLGEKTNIHEEVDCEHLKQRDDVLDERLGKKEDALGVSLGVNMKPETDFMLINKGQFPIKKDRLNGCIRDRLTRCHF